MRVGERIFCVKGDKVIVSPSLVLEPGHVLLNETGLVIEVTKARPHGVDVIEAEIVCPGFVDIHNHGFGHTDTSADVTDFWTDPAYTCSKLIQQGTTSVLATVMFKV